MEITIAVLITFIITFCMAAVLVNLACKDPYIEMDFMNPPKENSYGFGMRKKGKTKTFNEFYCTSEEIERKDKIIEQLTKEKDELEKELQAHQAQMESEKELRLCITCEYRHFNIETEPCKSCDDFTKNNYKHK